MKSRLYVSETAEASHAEVEELNISLKRPLISFSIGRPFKSCNKPVSFGDKELDSGIVASQKTRVPEFDMQRMERDVGVQAADAGKEVSSQTTWNRLVNKTTQYQPSVETEAIGVGPDAPETDVDVSSVANMLKGTIGKVEAALQQNETVNIFTDAMANVGDDDGTIGSKMENQLKELRNFTDLDFSKGKVRRRGAK